MHGSYVKIQRDGFLCFSPVENPKAKLWTVLFTTVTIGEFPGIQLPLPEGVSGPHDLLIDPKHPKTILVSCWPRTENGNDINGGVIKTTDGGKSWQQVFDERVRVNSAGLDPEHPNVIYINTFQNSAYRSIDSGTTWQRIEGYRFKWGQRAVPDINNPGMLFLTTYGGSVFYGPAEGTPGTPDDIVNMPEGWW